MKSIIPLGSYHFLPGGGGRLSEIAGRQFFLVPPLAYGEKFWSPTLPTAKNFDIVRHKKC